MINIYQNGITIMTVIRILGWLILIILLVVGAALVYLTISGYHPRLLENLDIQGTDPEFLEQGNEFTFLTWNIGYSGLGKDMDFFYEGGKRVRPDKTEFERYFHGIRDFISKQDSADFIFLQEVDIYAKRSYFVNESDSLSHDAGKLHPLFVKNYDCRYVPLPLYAPMGRVESGILTLTRKNPFKAVRHSYTANFSWPKSLFFLKRCFLEIRYHLKNGKDLVIVNMHNSTYDKDGKLRKAELEQLKEFIMTEWGKGNYIVAGGDWNINPRGFDPARIATGDPVREITPSIGPKFLPGWRFAFDPSLPTNRDVDMAYRKGITKTTIIDFFVVSPNVEMISVQTIPTGFLWADHQPVIMKIRLKKDA